MVAARTIGTLIVIAMFLGYVYAANVYVQTTYFRRYNAGPAVPIQETFREVARTINDYLQVAAIIVVAMIVVNIAVKSRRILGIIPFKDVQRHLLLLGPTGAGKTMIAKDIVRRAVGKNVKVTVLDWKAGI